MNGGAYPHHHERNGRDHVRSIEAELVRQSMASGRRLFVVDVRSREEFDGPNGRIPGAVSVPLEHLLGRRAELDRFKYDLLVLVSRDGNSSRLAGLELEFADFADVRTLEGGMSRWWELGYPVELHGSSRAPGVG